MRVVKGGPYNNVVFVRMYVGRASLRMSLHAGITEPAAAEV